MVAIVTGARLGLVGNSASLLGSQGQLGTALLGQAGSLVTVNAASGNLIIQSQDEMLLGKGPDDVITNTYNSLTGTYTANGWQESYQRHLSPVSGGTGVNTPGSTITHYCADGSEVLYTYNANYNGVACYVGNEAAGAYDTLTYSSTNSEWTWTDGKSRYVDIYDATTGRLKSVKDTDGNTMTYSYDGSGRLDRITTANGDATHDYTRFVYNGATTQVASIETTFWDQASAVKTQTRTSYIYDGSGRLTTVTVDLTPDVTTDSKTYVTTYGYDGTSNRIASISQSDGTRIDITYTATTFLVASVAQTVASGVTATTSFRYGSGWTTVTDPQGNSTTLVYDTNNRLIRMISPSAVTDGPAQLRTFSYDGNGNLLYSALLPNSVGDINFSSYATTWNDLTITPSVATTQSTERDGGIMAYRRMTNATAASGTVMSLGQGTALSAYTAVTAGQTIQFSAYTASSGASAVKLYAIWRNSSGTELSRTAVTGTKGGSLSTGGLAAANFVSGTGTVPAGAAYVELMVEGTADGTGVLNVAIARPTVVILGTGLAPATTYTYDSSGNVLSMTDALGQQTLYTYDSKNQLLTRTVYADASTPQTTRYVYDGESHLTYAISALGEVTQYIYNAPGQQTAVAQYTTNLYDVSALATSASPSLTEVNNWLSANFTDKSKVLRTAYTYDQRGAVLYSRTYSDIDPVTGGATIYSTTNFTYDQSGRLLSRWITGMTGTESYVYDGLGRITKFTAFNGKDTKTDYYDNATGLQTVVTLANTTTQTSTYDRAGELVSYAVVGTGVNTTIQYTYDSNGNLIQAKDTTTGLSTFSVYDELNRKVADVATDGAVTAYIYNTYDQLVRTIAYANRLTTTQLNLLKNATTSSASITLSQVTPTASTTTDRWNWSIYDNDGRLVQTIDGLGNVVAFAYDKADRLIKTTAYATQLAAATVTGYQTTPPVTAVTVTTDSAKDRVTRVFYDNDGRMVASLDAEGYLTELEYDGAGQKRHTIAYYNATNAANRATGSLSLLKSDLATSTANDIHNWYLYDTAGRLRAAVDGEGYVTRYDSYNAAGFVGKVTRGGPKATVTMATAWGDLPATAGTLEVVNYTYDQYGHILTRKLTPASGALETTTYAYDDVYNLTSQTTQTKNALNSSVQDDRVTTIRYDGLGRKTAELSGVGSAVLATKTTTTDKEQVWTDYATTYAYDTAGRLISQRDADGNRTLFYYDDNGRLTYQVNADGGVVKYGYNAFDERVEVWSYANPIGMTVLPILTGGRIVTDLTGAIAPDGSRDSHSLIDYDVDGQVKKTTVDRVWVSGVLQQEVTDFSYNAFGEETSRIAPYKNTATVQRVQTDRTYDRRGLLLSTTADTAALKIKTSYSYDAFGRVNQVTDPNNVVRTTSYNRNSQVWLQSDGMPNSTEYLYDAFGHVVTINDRTGATTGYAYDAFSRTVTITDANGKTTITTNNAYGQTVRVVDRSNTTTTYAFDADGNLTSTKDGLNNDEVRVYDKAGLLSSVTSPAGVVTTYNYQGGRLESQTVTSIAGGLKTSWSYDGKGLVTAVVDATYAVTTYTYDLVGNKATQVVDPSGLNLITKWDYDGSNTLTVTSPAGIVTLYTYDTVGRLASEAVDPTGLNLKTMYGYDANGNVTSVTDPEGKVTRKVYDNNNRVIFAIDPNGIVTGYSYDNEDRVIQTVRYVATYTATGTPVLATLQALSTTGASITRMVYDVGGRLIYSIDPLGAVTGYKYTGNDSQVTQTTLYNTLYTTAGTPSVTALDALSTTAARITRTVYDAAGQVIYSIDPLGRVTGYKYNGDGRVTQQTQYATLYTTSGTPNVTTLNGLGTAADLITRTVYDGAGRVIYSIDETGAVTGYTYDPDGRVTQTTRYATLYTATGTPNLTTLNALGTSADVVTRATYDVAGRAVYTIDPDGVVNQYSYDKDGRVTRSIRYYTAFTASGPQTLAYMRDTWVATKADATKDLRSYSYYDKAGRLAWSLSAVNNTANTGSVTGYTYDKNGRVTKTVRYATELTVGAGVDPAVTAVQAVATNAADLWTRYAYDDGGRLAYIIGSAEGTAETIDDSVTAYKYDTLGNVIQTVQYLNRYAPTDVPSRTTLDTWVGTNGGVNGGTNDLVTRALYDADGRLIYAVDATGAVVKYDYDSFDKVKTETHFSVTYGGAAGALVKATLDALSATDSRAINYTYRADGSLDYSIDAGSRRTDYSYDNFGHVTQTAFYLTGTPAEKLITRHVYNAVGREAYSVDPAGSVVAYSYDAWGHVIQTIQYSKVSALSGNQDMTTMASWVSTNADSTNDRVTRSLYDDDRLAYTVDGYGAVTKYSYNFQGLLKGTLQLNGRYTTPGLLNLTTMQNLATDAAKDHSTGYGYDNDGNRTNVTDAMGVQTQTWYDAFGRKTRTDVAYSSSDVVRTNWAYDTNGLVTQTAAYGAGNDTAVTTSTYNALGWMISSTDGNTYATTYEYDKDGRLTKTTVPTGAAAGSATAVTSRVYNTFGDLKKLTDPSQNAGYFYYDGLGRQICAVDAMGYMTRTDYGLTGDVSKVTRVFKTVTVTDANYTTAPPANPTGSYLDETSFKRDGAGRVLESYDGENNKTTYTYDALGNRKSMTNPALVTTNYTYYTSGLLKSEDRPATTLPGNVAIAPASTTNYVYDTFGNRTNMTEAAGATEQRSTFYEYDLNNRLKKQTGDTVPLNGGPGLVTLTKDFQYDKRGNLVYVKDATGAITVTFYDKMNRQSLQVDALGYAIAWTYDDNGNVLTQKSYDTKGSAGPDPFLAAPVPTGTFRETDYTYDKENRLLKTTIQGVKTGTGTGAVWNWVIDPQTSQASTKIETSMTYDASGNVLTQTDGNGKTIYTYYDKLGRKVAQVDQDNYLTTYKYDAEGNVTEQVQYAKALSGSYATWTNPPATPGVDANDADRKTTFVYDHNGHVTSQTRVGGSYWAVSDGTGVPSGGTNGLPAGGMTNLTGDLVVAFTYNNLGLVSRRTEANGDYTDYVYDGLGRVARITTGNAAAGNIDTANVMTTQTTYNGLGDVATTIAGYGGTVEEKTTYTYGIGGRLLSRTDAENYIVSYGYDGNGRQTVESYVRNGVTEGTLTTYDALGHVTRTAKATQSGSTWTNGDTTDDTFYNAFGEVIARGTNTGATADITKAQQFADYDAAGRVWRTNMDGGATKVFGYDGNGNVTVQVVSQGATNLATAADLTAALGLTGTVKTFNIYDNRNELTDVKRPTSVNLDNTVSSGGNMGVGSAGTVSVVQTNAGGQVGSNTVGTFKLSLSNTFMTTHNGTGKIHVVLTSSDGQTRTSAALDPGTLDLGTYSFSYMTTAPGQNGPYQPVVTVKVYQDGPNGSQILLWDPNKTDVTSGSSSFTVVCYYSAQFTQSKVQATGVGLTLQNLDPATSSVKVYVRPANTGVNYIEAPATPIYDVSGNPIPGSFSIDPYLAPFNGALNSSWEIKYIARDVNNKILDAKVATVTSGASSPLSLTLGYMAATQVFTAAVQGDGSFILTATTLASGYSDTLQTFNAFGDIKTQTDANNNITSFTYDVMGNLTTKSSAKVGIMGEDGKLKEDAAHNTSLSIVEEYRYDASGRLVGRVDGNGYITSQRLLAGTGYNKTQALATEQYNPITNDIVRTRYDAFNNVVKQIDATGVEVNYVFDKDNRLTSVKHAVRADSSQLIDNYTYDILDQRVSHTNNVFKYYNSGTGTWIPYAETTSYDLQGRVTQSVTFGGQITGYSYAWVAATSTGESTMTQENSGAWTRTMTAWGRSSSTTTNVFGKLVSAIDFGSHSTNYDYNFTAQISHQDSTAGQNIDYLYTTSGLLAAVNDVARSDRSVYAYDNYGNRTVEAYYHSGNAPAFYQTATITYDAMNRVSRFYDSEADISYAYDANSNRRRIKSTYAILTPYGFYAPGIATSTTDYWYTYDKSNRMLISKGNLSGTTIVAGADTIVLSYNTRGDRTQADYGTGAGAHSEYYGYSADGYLETIAIKNPTDTNPKQRVVRTNDILGRMTYQVEKKDDLSNSQTRSMTYDMDNRVTDETDTSYTQEWINGATRLVTTTSTIHNDYRLKNGSYWTGTDIGQVTHTSTAQHRVESGASTTDQNVDATFTFVWWGGAKSQTTTVVATTTGTTTYSYDVNGYLTQVYDAGAPRRVSYQNDVFGQVVTRQEYIGVNAADIGARRSFFYLNGRVIGDGGSDRLASEIDYAQQLAMDDNTYSRSWYGQNGTEIISTNGHTDTYEAFNNTSVDQSGSTYTASAGDTLQSVAMSIWGDSTLWYLLAEANGLGAGTTLGAGQVLTVPGKSTNLLNDANTLKAYDPTDAMGNTTPTQPQPPRPKQHGCGVVGLVIAIIVAAAVAYFTRRLDIASQILKGAVVMAASDAAFQVTQIAVGNQSKFNWKELGAAAVSGGIMGAMGPVTQATTFKEAVLQGLQANAIRQRVNQAFGLQKKFDWTSYAVAGLTAGVMHGVDPWIQQNISGDFATSVVSTTVETVTGAALRTALTGQEFGKSLREALPDALLHTIGDMIGAKFAESVSRGLHIGDFKVVPDSGVNGGNIHTHPDEEPAPSANPADIAATQDETNSGSTVWVNPKDSPLTNPYYFDEDFQKIGADVERMKMEVDQMVAEVNSQAFDPRKAGKGASFWKWAREDLGAGASNEDVEYRALQYMEFNPGVNPRKIREGHSYNVPSYDQAVSEETFSRYAKSDKELRVYYEARAEAARQREMEAFYQKYPGMRPIDRTCSMYNRYNDNGAIVDYDPRALPASARSGNDKPFVMASYQAALDDATKRFSTVSLPEAAFVQGFTFNFADEIDAYAAYGETAVNNYLHQFGITKGAPYSAGQARNAVLEVDRTALAEMQESHPVTYTVFNIAGAVANPLNRVGGSWIAAGEGLGGVMLRSALVGGATGAVYGAGNGTDWQSRGEGALWGGGSGFVIGGAVPVAGKYLVEPTIQWAKPWLARMASMRLEVEPGTIGSLGGNWRFVSRAASQNAEEFETFFRGDEFARTQFRSNFAELNGVDASNELIATSQQRGTVSQLFAAHAEDSAKSAFIGVSRSEAVADHFARGLFGDQEGYVTVFKLPKGLAKPNLQNTITWEQEHLVATEIDPKYIVGQYQVGKK